MSPIGIAIVDDHDLFRAGLRLVLEQVPGFRVLFDVSDAEGFFRELEQERPDVVLMDINLPGMDGATTTSRARARHPGLKVIALTMFDDHLHYSQMVQAGAEGFLLKKGSKEELRQAVTEVARGGVYFSPEILRQAVSRTERKDGDPSLTTREQDVLDLVCRGLTTNEMAERLCISSKTVEGHRANLFQKAGVRNLAELILWAFRQGFVAVD